MSTSELVARWAVAFALTQAVECVIYCRLFHVKLAVAFAASAITHPIVVFAIWHLWGWAYVVLTRVFPGFVLGDSTYFFVYGAIAETFAIVFEALWLARIGRLGLRRGAVASIVANAASGLLGLLASWLTGWP